MKQKKSLSKFDISEISKSKINKYLKNISQIQINLNTYLEGLANGMNIDLCKYSFNAKTLSFESKNENGEHK